MSLWIKVSAKCIQYYFSPEHVVEMTVVNNSGVEMRPD